MMTLSVLNNFTPEGVRAGLAFWLTLFIFGVLAVAVSAACVWVGIKKRRARGRAPRKKIWPLIKEDDDFVAWATYLSAVVIGGALIVLFEVIYSVL